MPLDARLLDDARLLYLRFHGVQDVPSIRMAMVQLRADPRYRPDLPELADLREVASSDMGFDHIRALLRLATTTTGASVGPKRVSFLVKPGVQFGSARMFAGMADVLPGDQALTISLAIDEAAALAFLDRAENCLADVPGFAAEGCGQP